MKNKSILFLIILSFSTHFFSQGNQYWYFGTNKLGLVFESSNGFNPNAINDKANNSLGNEGCAVAYSKNGKLLLYTDGNRLFNGKHQIISNGLGANTSDVQSAIICPKTDECNKFFVFVHNSISRNLVRYIVDLDGNNKVGAIESGPVLMGLGMYDASFNLIKTSETRFWLINRNFAGQFVSYEIVDGVISLLPATSAIPQIPITNANHVVSISENNSGNKLIYTFNFKAHELNFDQFTGQVTFAKSYTIPAASARTRIYDAEWSDDDNFVYLGTIGPDATSGGGIDLIQIERSSSTIRTVYQSNNKERGGGLKIGPNGTIYFISDRLSNYLSTITTGNLSANDPGFSFNIAGFNANIPISGFNFPQTISSKTRDDLKVLAGPDNTICLGTATNIGSNLNEDAYTYSWSPILNVGCVSCKETTANPIINTQYILTATDNICTNTDTVNITVAACPILPCDLSPDWYNVQGIDQFPAYGSDNITDAAGNVYQSGAFFSTKKTDDPSDPDNFFDNPKYNNGQNTFVGVDAAGQFFVNKFDNCGKLIWTAFGSCSQNTNTTLDLKLSLSSDGQTIILNGNVPSPADVIVTDGQGTLFSPKSNAGTFVISFQSSNGKLLGVIESFNPKGMSSGNPKLWGKSNSNNTFILRDNKIEKYSKDLNTLIATFDFNNSTDYNASVSSFTIIGENLYIIGSYKGKILNHTTPLGTSDLLLIKMDANFNIIGSYVSNTNAQSASILGSKISNRGNNITITGLYALNNGTFNGLSDFGNFLMNFNVSNNTFINTWTKKISNGFVNTIAQSLNNVYLFDANTPNKIQRYNLLTGIALSEISLENSCSDIGASYNQFFISGSILNNSNIKSFVRRFKEIDNIFMSKNEIIPNQLVAFPNPLIGESITINSKNNLFENNAVECDIYTISGLHIKSLNYQQKDFNNLIINDLKLNSGMYLIKITSNSVNETIKLKVD